MSPRAFRPVFRTLVRAVPGLVLAAGLAACASEEKTTANEVRALVDHGRYDEAVRKAAAEADSKPGDPAAESLYKDASVAYLLEKGRRLTFKDHDLEALREFREALAIEPESKEVRAWIDKTNAKLSHRWLGIALELHAKDEIEEALKAYDNALQFAPGDKSALTGRVLSLSILNRRDNLGKKYFRDGLRALSDYWLEQARSRFTYAKKYQPTDDRTVARKGQVETLIAIERLTLARDYEQKGKFGAARNEYRLALALDKKSAEAKKGLERCRNEAKVSEKLDRARMSIVRGRFDAAAKLVDEASNLTEMQKDRCEGTMASIREARLDQMYKEAVALERDFRFEEAVTKYGEILAQADFYKDVLARRDYLDESMRRAADLYAKAQAAETPAKKLELLKQIAVVWPEYKDVVEQTRALEAALAGGSAH